MQRTLKFGLCFGVVALATLPLWAGDAGTSKSGVPKGWGAVGGVGISPTQLIVGGQYNFGQIAPRVDIEPNVQLGLFDDDTLLTGTAAAYYRFPGDDEWLPYAGGGVTLGFKGSDFGAAIKFSGGVRKNLASDGDLLLQLDLGIGDFWDAQFMVGYCF